MTMPIEINRIASWCRAVCFTAAGVCVLVMLSGCDQVDALNECQGDAPTAPPANAFTTPLEGFGLVQGFGTTVLFENVFIDDGFIRFQQPSMANMRAAIGQVDSDDINENDLQFIVAGYTRNGIDHTGSGTVRISRSENDSLVGVFAACVSTRDLTFNIRGPWRLIRGAFHVSL